MDLPSLRKSLEIAEAHLDSILKLSKGTSWEAEEVREILEFLTPAIQRFQLLLNDTKGHGTEEWTRQIGNLKRIFEDRSEGIEEKYLGSNFKEGARSRVEDPVRHTRPKQMAAYHKSLQCQAALLISNFGAKCRYFLPIMVG